MERIEELLQKVLSDAAALPEDRMRLKSLGARLSGLTDVEIAQFFGLLYKKSLHNKAVRKAQSVFIDPRGLREIFGEDRFKRIYLASIELGLTKVSRLFTDLPPIKKGLHGYDKEEDARMEFISLGMRRTLSKTALKDTLDRLLSDPDVIVVSNILNNPRVIEKDILKIASKRPNSPEILKLIISHAKWSKRYNVIKAVAQNPYTQPRVAMALLEFLLSQDLKQVSADKTLHPQVRVSAREILKHREEGRG